MSVHWSVSTINLWSAMGLCEMLFGHLDVFGSLLIAVIRVGQFLNISVDQMGHKCM